MLDEMISQRDEVFIVPEHMQEGIRQGIEDIKNGNSQTMEDFEKRFMNNS